MRHLKKNVADEVFFPMVSTADNDVFISGESVTDTAYYKDGAGAWTALAITDTVTEIASTGLYEVSLTAAELNHDFVIIKLTSTNGQDSAVVIKTFDVDVDDLVRSATPANTLAVLTGGQASSDIDMVNGVTITGDGSVTPFNV